MRLLPLRVAIDAPLQRGAAYQWPHRLAIRVLGVHGGEGALLLLCAPRQRSGVLLLLGLLLPVAHDQGVLAIAPAVSHLLS